MANLCDNCHSPLSGDYCAECGQSTATIDLPVREFAVGFATEALALDSRLRQTLVPLFLKPGRIAKEYVEGRRARFVPPIRLYLFASFLMFLVLTFGSGLNVRETSMTDGGATAESVGGAPADDNPGATAGDSVDGSADGAEEAPDPEPVAAEESDVPDDSSPNVRLDLGGGDLERSLEQRLSDGFERFGDDREALSRDFLSRLAQSFFFLLPAFAFFLKLVYWRRLYVHHVVFAIYFHAFVFLLAAAVGLPEAFGLAGPFRYLDALLLAVPVYMLVAMKRFYGGSWLMTVWKAFLVSTAYNLLGAVTMIALLVLVLLGP